MAVKIHLSINKCHENYEEMEKDATQESDSN